MGLSLTPEGEEPLFDHRGPALNYLELTGPSSDRHWQMTSTFISPTKNIAVITLVLRQLHDLWTAAKAVRHIDSPESHVFHPLSLEMIETVLDADRKTGFTPTGFSERLPSPDA